MLQPVEFSLFSSKFKEMFEHLRRAKYEGRQSLCLGEGGLSVPVRQWVGAWGWVGGGPCSAIAHLVRWDCGSPSHLSFIYFFYYGKISDFYLFIYFWLFRAVPVAYGGFQARDPIVATATGLRQSHSNTRSEPHLGPIPQLTATPDP